MKKIRLLIADDHPVLRQGIIGMFRDMSDYEVIGWADNGPDAVKKASSLKPDVVIMDIVMPGMDGVEATKRITEACPGAKVIIFSMHKNTHYAAGALRSGAMGYVLKDADPGELLQAVKQSLSGRRYLSPELSDDLLNGYVIHKNAVSDPFNGLSDREKEVLRHLAEGVRCSEIAGKLFISSATVKKHRGNIMRKLKVDSIPALVKLTIQHGFK